MEKSEYALDHIDPQWKEGRDYQLVCGLDVSINLRVEDNDINIRKSNRFVPYRLDNLSSGIPLHQAPGDWGFFLVGGEWKLTQFMGREWWEESKKIGYGTVASVESRRNSGIMEAHGEWLGEFAKETGHLQRISHLGAQAMREKAERGEIKRDLSFDHQSNAGKHGAAVSNKVQFRCTITGKVANSGALTNYQKARGIDTSNRVKAIQ
jgi:hypothetical protein